jgi:hypothetical protein
MVTSTPLAHGRCTVCLSLVVDGGVESQNPPPDGPFVVEPVLVEDNSIHGYDLRRSGEPIPADAGQTVWGETIKRLTNA